MSDHEHERAYVDVSYSLLPTGSHAQSHGTQTTANEMYSALTSTLSNSVAALTKQRELEREFRAKRAAVSSAQQSSVVPVPPSVPKTPDKNMSVLTRIRVPPPPPIPVPRLPPPKPNRFTVDGNSLWNGDVTSESFLQAAVRIDGLNDIKDIDDLFAAHASDLSTVGFEMSVAVAVVDSDISTQHFLLKNHVFVITHAAVNSDDKWSITFRSITNHHNSPELSIYDNEVRLVIGEETFIFRPGHGVLYTDARAELFEVADDETEYAFSFVPEKQASLPRAWSEVEGLRKSASVSGDVDETNLYLSWTFPYWEFSVVRDPLREQFIHHIEGSKSKRRT